jgi:hypothetical protein
VRVLWTDIESYPTLEDARAGRRRSIARRHLLPEPKPQIYKMGDEFILVGMAVMRPWGDRQVKTGVWREHLVGKPIPPRRPKQTSRIKKLRRWKRVISPRSILL